MPREEEIPTGAETHSTRTTTGKATPSLKLLAIRGSAWTTLAFGANQVLRLVSNLVLTRLLFPEVFGLMALANVFMQGLRMFSDVGLSPSVIQNKHGDEREFLNTAWTIQIVRGVILWVCACLLAVPVARFYGEPLLSQIIPVAGLTALIAGFSSTKLLSCKRHLLLGRLKLIEVGSYVVSCLVMIVVAFPHPSAWALVVGALAGSVVKMILSHRALPGEANRFHWDSSAASQLLGFGKWIFLATAFYFLGSQVDRILLGRYMSMAELGVYSIALFLSNAILRLLSAMSHSIYLPVFSRIICEDASRVPSVYKRTRRTTENVVLPMAGLLMVNGSLAIDVLYDDRYSEAGWMLEILVIGVAVRCTTIVSGTVLLAYGNPSYATLINALKLIAVAIGIPVAWHFFGVVGAVSVVAALPFLSVPITWLAMRRYRLFSLRMELQAASRVGIGLALGVVLEQLIFLFD